LQNGIFEHKNISDGSSSNASLIAVGQGAAFAWQQASSNVVSVRAGGNLMYVPAGDAQYSANIWDYAGEVPTGESYGIMASGQLLLERSAADDITDATSFNNGSAFSLSSGLGFFNLLNFRDYTAQGTTNARRVNLSLTPFGTQIDYVTSASTKYTVGGQVVRAGAPAASTNGGTLADAASVGALQALGDAAPASFAVSR
jgi:hypothetical protein